MPRGNPNLHLNNTPWPTERTNRLRHLFALGTTDQRIAEELGISVRAVIGKRLRLGLKRYASGDALEEALRRSRREKAKEDQF